jgi:tetratricopeptide (TPR) repeat protein
MKRTTLPIPLTLLLLATQLSAQTPATPQQPLPTASRPPDPDVAAGATLDLSGNGEQARAFFAKALQHADTAERKLAALRAVAISYAFEANCQKTIEYEEQAFKEYAAAHNNYQQGEVADEAARVCLDSGDLDEAAKWYKIGHDVGLQEPEIKPARRDLWEFRWEHAQARIAARRSNTPEAQKHVAAAKSIFDRGAIPEQAVFVPYLVGYVAFYAGDYSSALEQFSKANQNDPFILCLIAQTYEKLGSPVQAADFYRKISTITAHNPPAAYAVPFSRKRLAIVR